MAETIDILIGDLRLGDAASQHTFDLTRALLAAGYRTRIVVNHRPGPLPDDLRGRIQQLHPGDYTPVADLTIVQYPIWYPLADRIEEAPGATLFWYHGITDPALWPDQATDLLTTSIARTSLAWHATLAVATSPYTAAELRRYADLPPERLRIVPLGVDATDFAAAATQAESLRRSLGLVGKRVLLYVGRVAGHKRIDLMLMALAALAPELPELHLLIVGDASGTVETRALTQRLQREAAALGIERRVTFTDRVPDVAPYFALADVYIQASQHEGFGVPLVEAMAAGTPIVAGASGAIPWVLDAEGPAPAGLLFGPGDAAELTERVRSLLTEPALAARLTASGRDRAAEFSLEQFNRRAVAVVQEALELAVTQERAGSAVGEPLTDEADIALRSYRVRSAAPLVGPLIEWVRTNSTTHLKEAYFDRTVEQQVNYNRRLAQEVVRLRERVREMEALLDQWETTAEHATEEG
jgi:glycosyltransferase involved in cell wall biosynthesis